MSLEAALPGVVGTYPDFEEPKPEASAPEETAASEAPVEAAAEGEEAAAEGSEVEAKAEGSEAAAEEPEKPAEVPEETRTAVLAALAEEAFERKYETPEQAVQAIKSAIGRSRRMEAERSAAVSAIESWKAHTAKLEAELEALKGGGPNPAAAGAEKATEATATSSANGSAGRAFLEVLGRQGWARYEELLEEKGPAFAAAWLLDQQERHAKAEMQALIDEREKKLLAQIEPSLSVARQVQEQRAVTEGVLEFLGAMELVTNEDGTPRFPWLSELGTEEDGAVLMREFMKLPPAMAFTPDGLELVGARMQRSRSATPAPAPAAKPTPKVGTSSNGNGRRPSEGAISARMPGMGVPTALRRGVATDDLEARIEELNERRSVLGF